MPTYVIHCNCRHKPPDLHDPGAITAQVMIAELMQHWGADGLDRHLKSIQTVYRRRAQLMHNSAEQVWPHCLLAP